jgi:hypothetical protein
MYTRIAPIPTTAITKIAVGKTISRTTTLPFVVVARAQVDAGSPDDSRQSVVRLRQHGDDGSPLPAPVHVSKPA